MTVRSRADRPVLPDKVRAMRLILTVSILLAAVATCLIGLAVTPGRLGLAVAASRSGLAVATIGRLAGTAGRVATASTVASALAGWFAATPGARGASAGSALGRTLSAVTAGVSRLCHESFLPSNS